MTGKLRITDVERIPLRVPFTPRCLEWNAREVWQWQVVEVIRVTTNEPDLVGYGETLPFYTWGVVTDAAVERVKGGHPGDLLGDDSLGAGLQMALYDVAGKALGVPAYRLFGKARVREWCPISWWNIDMPPEALAAEAKEAMAKGYTAYKTKARPWWDVFEQVAAVSEATPPHFSLELDWNQMLINVGNAAPVLTELDKCERVGIYESPIMQRDIEGLRQLRSKITHPIALHFGDPPYPVTVRDEVCDGFVIGGGVSQVLQQGTLAQAFDKPFWLQLVGTGLTTALSLQLGAVLPMAQWPAVNCMNNYSDDLLAEPLVIAGGYAHVPEAPGLGIQVDEEALSRYRAETACELEKPQALLSIVWPGGMVRHYADIHQVWTDGFAGNIPAQARGVTMKVTPDDGTPEWADLFARAQKAPVHDAA